MPVISPEAKVLVTGANGFLAIHVVRAFLEHHYSVRGTVRSHEKSVHLHKLFSSYGDKFETVVVKDITQVRRLKICHTSRLHPFGRRVLLTKQSRVSMLSPTPPLHSILKLTTQTVCCGGSLHELECDALVQSLLSLPSTARRGSFKVPTRGVADHFFFHVVAHSRSSTTIKRIVILSSTAAISNAPDPRKVYTEEDWNDAAVNAVEKRGKGALGNEKYSASKTLAEKGEWMITVTYVVPVAKVRFLTAAWDWYDANKASVKWDLTTINPPYVSLCNPTPPRAIDRYSFP
jgi:NAD(P)-dependent dehydrogenase (short-subunit alcohol dehydrogenase family)